MKATNPHNATFYTIYDNYTSDDAFDGTYAECMTWKADMKRLYPFAVSKGRWGDPIWRKGGK
jgi:hypothetical protein